MAGASGGRGYRVIRPPRLVTTWRRMATNRASSGSTDSSTRPSRPAAAVDQHGADHLARVTAQMLGELIAGLTLRPGRVELSTELIVRESTAAPAVTPGASRCG
jgi:hypothetical protein